MGRYLIFIQFISVFDKIEPSCDNVSTLISDNIKNIFRFIKKITFERKNAFVRGSMKCRMFILQRTNISKYYGRSFDDHNEKEKKDIEREANIGSYKDKTLKKRFLKSKHFWIPVEKIDLQKYIYFLFSKSHLPDFNMYNFDEAIGMVDMRNGVQNKKIKDLVRDYRDIFNKIKIELDSAKLKHKFKKYHYTTKYDRKGIIVMDINSQSVYVHSNNFTLSERCEIHIVNDEDEWHQ